MGFFHTVDVKLMVSSGLELSKADKDSYYGQHCSGLHVIIPVFLSCPIPVLSVTEFPFDIQAT